MPRHFLFFSLSMVTVPSLPKVIPAWHVTDRIKPVGRGPVGCRGACKKLVGGGSGVGEARASRSRKACGEGSGGRQEGSCPNTGKGKGQEGQSGGEWVVPSSVSPSKMHSLAQACL